MVLIPFERALCDVSGKKVPPMKFTCKPFKYQLKVDLYNMGSNRFFFHKKHTVQYILTKIGTQSTDIYFNALIEYVSRLCTNSYQNILNGVFFMEKNLFEPMF